MVLIFEKKCGRCSLCVRIKFENRGTGYSFIIDTSDDYIKNLFSEIEWEEIMNVNKKTIPAIDENIGMHLMSYKKKTLSNASTCYETVVKYDT